MLPNSGFFLKIDRHKSKFGLATLSSPNLSNYLLILEKVTLKLKKQDPKKNK